jgi:hypothetical protein
MIASMRPVALTWSAMLLTTAALRRSPTTIPAERDASSAMVAARPSIGRAAPLDGRHQEAIAPPRGRARLCCQ